MGVDRGLSRATSGQRQGQVGIGRVLDAAPGNSRETELKELRYHLAVLKQKEALAADAQRHECEALLEGAVELRAEKRYLQQETSDFRNYLGTCQAEHKVFSERFDKKNMHLHSELAVHRLKLDEARSNLSRLNAEWVLEDNPEEALAAAKRRVADQRKQHEEWEHATLAAEELSDRLSLRLGDLEEEAYAAKNKMKTGKDGLKSLVTPAEFRNLQEETRMLSAKVAIESVDVHDARRHLQLHGDTEIPRLKAADAERRRLQKMLMDTRWQHDNLQRDYDRVIRGLQEQENVQEQKSEEYAESIRETRDEGEEMLVSVKQNDLQIAEMRHDRMETELFVQHLNNHIARLEDERVRLKEVIKDAATAERRPGFDPNVRKLGPDGHNEVLSWLREDREKLLNENTAALRKDEAEAAAVESQCEDAELQLMQVEERNAMLRSEVSMAEPLLANAQSQSQAAQNLATSSPYRQASPQTPASPKAQSQTRGASPKPDKSPKAAPKKTGFFRNR